jgi:hypothetical protein
MLTFEHQAGEGAPLFAGERPNYMVGGAMQYGARRGIWNILELLEKFRVKAGFKEIVNVPERNIPMIHAGLATTRDSIKEHRDRSAVFSGGYIEAVRYAVTNPKETKQIIGTFTKTTNQEDLDETYQTFIKVWERLPYVSAAAVQSVLNSPAIPALSPRSRKIIDNSLLNELEKSGFGNQLYGR